MVKSQKGNSSPKKEVRLLDATREAVEEYSLRIWAMRHMRTEKGEPLTFEEKPWLKAIYDDPHPRQVIQKPAQVGMTMYGIVRATFLAAVRSQTVIFTQPTQDDARSFSMGRLNRILHASPEMRAFMQGGARPGHRPADSAEIKHIGGGTLYVRGTMSEGAALSIPGDAIFHDEVDRSDPEKLAMYAHRLDAHPYEDRQLYEFSTPTVPGYGIAARYEASDAREWLVRCQTPGCKWQGSLDYWEHTEGHLLYLRCTWCGKPLDPRRGEWVPMHPERSRATHGYRISRLFGALPDEPALLLGLHEQRTSSTFQRHFENMALGVPSTEGSTQITRAQIQGACFLEDYPMHSVATYGTGPYFMGVDQGDTLTVLIGRADPTLDGGRIRIVYMARLRDPSRGSAAWKQVAELMKLFRIRMCVVDANPNSANAHDLARAFPERVLTIYYSHYLKQEFVLASDVTKRAAEPPAFGQSQPLPSTERSDLTVNRTEALDRTVDNLLHGMLLLPGPPNAPEVSEFITHCVNNVRLPLEGRQGELTYKWQRTGANDYFHALNYLRLAFERGRDLAALNQVYLAPPMVVGVRQGSLRRPRSPLDILLGPAFGLSGGSPSTSEQGAPHSARDKRWFGK